MRRLWVYRIVVMVTIILINLILQSVLFSSIAFKGIVPNIFIITIVTFGLLRGKAEAATMGLVIGLCQDILYGQSVGVYAIIYMNIGYFTGFLYRNFYRDSLLIPIGVIALADFLQNFTVYFFTFLFRGRLSLGTYTYQIMIPEIIYTLFIGFILYRVYYSINEFVEHKEWLKENED